MLAALSLLARRVACAARVEHGAVVRVATHTQDTNTRARALLSQSDGGHRQSPGEEGRGARGVLAGAGTFLQVSHVRVFALVCA